MKAARYRAFWPIRTRPSWPAGAPTRLCSAWCRTSSGIYAKGLRVADELPREAVFATEAGVSRTVVREAFGGLAAIGLIDVGAGRRARVGAVNPSVIALVIDHSVRTDQINLQQIWDVRRSLELRTATLAATRRTDEEAMRLLNHAQAMRRYQDDKPTMALHDAAFHRTIAEASRNALFAHIISAFGLVLERTATYLTRPHASSEMQIHQHELIARAIANRDPEAARQAMYTHFDWSLRLMIDAGMDYPTEEL